MVRAGIKAGMLALPTRETFMASIGETGAVCGVGAVWVRCGGCIGVCLGRVEEGFCVQLGFHWCQRNGCSCWARPRRPPSRRPPTSTLC